MDGGEDPETVTRCRSPEPRVPAREPRQGLFWVVRQLPGNTPHCVSHGHPSLPLTALGACHPDGQSRQTLPFQGGSGVQADGVVCHSAPETPAKGPGVVVCVGGRGPGTTWDNPSVSQQVASPLSLSGLREGRGPSVSVTLCCVRKELTENNTNRNTESHYPPGTRQVAGGWLGVSHEGTVPLFPW